MLIQCTKCAARFEVDERRIGPAKRKLRCSFCNAVFYVSLAAPGRPVETGGEEPVREEDADDPENNPELMGTMILSLFNKPRHVDGPPSSSSKGKGEEILPGGAPPTTTGGSRVRRVVISPARKAELFQHCGWIPEMDREEMKVFVQFWELYRIAAGTTVFQQGDSNANVGLIVKGEVAIGYDDGDDYDPELALLGPGKSMGELSLVDDLPRATQAVTHSECFLFVLTKKRADLMAERYPRLWRLMFLKIARMMSRRIRVASGRLVDYLEK